MYFKINALQLYYIFSSYLSSTEQNWWINFHIFYDSLTQKVIASKEAVERIVERNKDDVGSYAFHEGLAKKCCPELLPAPLKSALEEVQEKVIAWKETVERIREDDVGSYPLREGLAKKCCPGLLPNPFRRAPNDGHVVMENSPELLEASLINHHHHHLVRSIVARFHAWYRMVRNSKNV